MLIYLHGRESGQDRSVQIHSLLQELRGVELIACQIWSTCRETHIQDLGVHIRVILRSKMDSEQSGSYRSLQPRAIRLTDNAIASTLEGRLQNEEDDDFSGESDNDEHFVIEIAQSYFDSECNLSETELETVPEQSEDLEHDVSDVIRDWATTTVGINSSGVNKNQPEMCVRKLITPPGLEE
uniref:Uncharacterized protein n=1 Tax=Timema monikensis TaxID=170555 RepID=A0A7R9EL47_9NEOP|nr:unnamed protein product [Timema monikensis]